MSKLGVSQADWDDDGVCNCGCTIEYHHYGEGACEICKCTSYNNVRPPMPFEDAAPKPETPRMRKIIIYDPKGSLFSIATVMRDPPDGRMEITRHRSPEDVHQELRDLLLTELGVPGHWLYPDRVLTCEAGWFPNKANGDEELSITAIGSSQKGPHYQYFLLKHLMPPKEIFVEGSKINFEVKDGVVTFERAIDYDYNGECRMVFKW